MTEPIQIIPLGAGQQVGRSCIVVKFKKQRTVIFDSGIHMQYSDMQKYPDYKFICGDKDINDVVDLVVITHFHLDHCGALPYLTQQFKYKGPIVATTPTKAMVPYMLEDFRKVSSDIKKEEKNMFVYSALEGRMSAEKIISIGLKETMTFKGITVTPYYAGHVLGAGMFYVNYDGLSVLYTGDYNSYADRHLGSAYAPRLNPNIIITETTYATTIRDTKRDRQRKMLKIITETIENGGKVLIPVFALGRAQELAVLLETYWNRTESEVPVYFSAGLIEKANFYYKLFIEWQNQKIKEDFLENNTFNFKKVTPFDKSLIRAEFPYVLFATPGMLHGGSSLQVFKEWCGNPKNTLIIPGYCVPGTFGNKLINNVRQLQIDHRKYDVQMRIQNISFSAHADAKGIINLIRHVNADNIVFVHGDKQKMQIFQEIVYEQLKKPVFRPANKDLCEIKCQRRHNIQIKGLVQPNQQGYLIKSIEKPLTSKQSLASHNKFKLVKDEENILKELNYLKELMFGISDNSVIIDKEIMAQYTTNDQTKVSTILSNNKKEITKKTPQNQNEQKQKVKQEKIDDFIDDILIKAELEEEQHRMEVEGQDQKTTLVGDILKLCKSFRELKD